MLTSVARYFSLVRFAHTVFALPFALISFVFAVKACGVSWDWGMFVKVLLCMVFARNAAMGFNRYADRRFDARNPRTQNREIPSGEIHPARALAFVVANALAFSVTAWFLNPLVFALSPVALFVLLGYSYVKRFSASCHFVLGVAMGMAPAGAFMAATGTLHPVPFLLAVTVFFWGSGFDILYALQDIAFDRQQGLHSVPALLGWSRARGVSILLHVFAALSVCSIGFWHSWGIWFWLGVLSFTALLAYQHTRISSEHPERIDAAFFRFNGLASVAFALLVVADLMW